MDSEYNDSEHIVDDYIDYVENKCIRKGKRKQLNKKKYKYIPKEQRKKFIIRHKHKLLNDVINSNFNSDDCTIYNINFIHYFTECSYLLNKIDNTLKHRYKANIKDFENHLYITYSMLNIKDGLLNKDEPYDSSIKFTVYRLTKMLTTNKYTNMTYYDYLSKIDNIVNHWY